MSVSIPSPERALSPPLTVRLALDLPSLRAGTPEVIAGGDHLDRPIRWVHIAESREIAAVLKSGELLLTEGNMFTGVESDDRLLIAELADRDIAGLIIELGARMPSVKGHIVQECQRRGIVLVALHLPVPFIDVTEQVHSGIVNYKVNLLDAAQQMQEALTDLILGGAGIAEMLEAFSEMIDNPVVFEAAHGGFVYQASRLVAEHDIAAAWQAHCRGLSTTTSAISEEIVVGGQAAGRLVALGLRNPFEAADRSAVKRAARLVSLVMMRDAHADSVASRNQRGFLSALMLGHLPAYRAEARATAAGFTSPVLLPFGARPAPHHRSRSTSIEDRLWRRVWDDISDELSSRHAAGIFDQANTAETTLVILGMDSVAERLATAERFAGLLQRTAERHFGEPDSVVISVGPTAHTWQAASEGLATCVDAMEGALHSPSKLWHDAVDLDLDRLLWSLRDNPDLERFASLRLEKLIHYDRQRRTQLVKTLQVLLEQNGQKAETARALHLERQSLYTRVERIESLLGVDLSQPDVRLSLHLAVRIMRMTHNSTEASVVSALSSGM